MSDFTAQVEYFDEKEWVEFWHSDEAIPFLKLRCDKLMIDDDCVKVYSRDYLQPIVIIFEYDYFKTSQ